ncbi:hypothetical protein BDZ91DRAFT_786128 [Kalaharituber pfeilii]|nr:hypothetical protein BDZ91DRAFT_786128 [Kalaharituber pfeilii]
MLGEFVWGEAARRHAACAGLMWNDDQARQQRGNVGLSRTVQQRHRQLTPLAPPRHRSPRAPQLVPHSADSPEAPHLRPPLSAVPSSVLRAGCQYAPFCASCNRRLVLQHVWQPIAVAECLAGPEPPAPLATVIEEIFNEKPTECMPTLSSVNQTIISLTPEEPKLGLGGEVRIWSEQIDFGSLDSTVWPQQDYVWPLPAPLRRCEPKIIGDQEGWYWMGLQRRRLWSCGAISMRGIIMFDWRLDGLDLM